MENGNAAKMNIHLKTTDGDVITDNLPQGKSERKEDSSLYENNVDGATSTLNVICRDGDINLQNNKSYLYMAHMTGLHFWKHTST